ncbi:hypothetical protein pqer_cds_1006 [Pandoravirus quercus]|uniref:Uncharacterized protein n=2 Tax=Pandoravirus TaxID=2060084 RepID=A0A2U7UAF1_9VIRU|nr:hypothetical protein pqer_cds_1006 [Pandoravirus quercus]AVK75428.1 hypothetical protein pqer_cds_1006 [Pandoravirus quercus]QBZ81608.1 hypothetical protein pclt_cds_1022 [Pandoravirus celtis]
MEQEQVKDITKPDNRPAQDLPMAKQQENPEEVLVDAALACVRWDESVDLDRLMALEFEHNLGLLAPRLPQTRPGKRPDHWKLHCLVKRARGTLSADQVSFLRSRGYADPPPTEDPVRLTYHDGVWSIDDAEHMTDAQLAGLLAISARQPSFWLWCSFSERVCFAHTWLACVVDGLAQRECAWTGIEIMRTRNLCIALAALIDAREKGGPLGRVDAPKSGPLDQGAVPAHWADAGTGSDLAVSMREALARAHRLAQAGFGFCPRDTFRQFPNGADAGDCTRRLLGSVQRGVERLYATEPYFLKLIAPSEYEAMVTEAPLAATFYH